MSFEMRALAGVSAVFAILSASFGQPFLAIVLAGISGALFVAARNEP